MNYTATLYDKTGKNKLGELTEILAGGHYVEEERNGIFEMSFDYPNGYPLANLLINENIVEVKPNDTQNLQKFRIYDTKCLMKDIITVLARHESFDLANDHVENVNLENASCEYALNTLFRNSHFSTHYRGYSDIINAQNYKIDNVNILNAIAGKEGSIIDTYGTGAEILRDGTNIHVLNKRGHDNEVTIEFGKNLTDFVLERDLTDLETRVGGFAKYTPEGGKETIVKSNWIDSPYIDNFAHPYINIDGRRDYSDKFKDGEIPTVEKLNKLCADEFKINKRDIPKSNYTIKFIALSKCVGYEGTKDKISLCDTVRIIDKRFNVDTKAKVIKYKYDFIKERYESMELGEPRTTLGDIIGGGGTQGPPGKDGAPGKDGVDGNIGDFPDSLPTTPILTANVKGWGSIDLSWTFEDKVYYTYELYASKNKDFIPNIFDLIHSGQSSSHLFQAKPGETWYFRVCAKNTHGNRTEFSPQVVVITKKSDDFEEYFSTLGVGNLVANIFSADYMEAGIIKANWVELKGASVIDGNGKRVFDIDSWGRMTLMPSVFKMMIDGKEEDVITKSQFEANNNFINMNFSQTGGTNEILNSKCTNSTDYMYTGGHTGSPNVVLFKGKPNLQFTVSNYGSAGGFQTSNIKVVGGEKHTLAFDYSFERAMETYCEIHFYSKKYEGFGVYPDIRKDVIKLDVVRGAVNHTVDVPSGANWMKFYIYASYNGVDSDKYPYAHCYVNELRCFKSNIAGKWVPASDEMYVTNMKFNGKGIEQTYNNEYKSRWGADALEFLTPLGVRKLAIDKSQICTYNFDDGNFLSFIGATRNSDYSKIFGNAISTSKHCAFFDISHQPNAIDDTEYINNATSYLRVNFYDHDDQLKGTHINKYPLYVHNNLHIDNNLHVTQDIEVWGDITCQRNIDVKRIRCRSGIDMVNMSVENAYAIKFAKGNGCLVKGDGNLLELGGQPANGGGGTRIGVSDSFGNVSETLWISASDFVWNKADWNFGGRNIYDANVYQALQSNYAFKDRLLATSFAMIDENDIIKVNTNEATINSFEENIKLKQINADLAKEIAIKDKELIETKKNLAMLALEVAKVGV